MKPILQTRQPLWCTKKKTDNSVSEEIVNMIWTNFVHGHRDIQIYTILFVVAKLCNQTKCQMLRDEYIKLISYSQIYIIQQLKRMN